MYTFQDLKEIIAKLRSQEGCPWDREQTFESLKKCLADETQEVFEAIDQNDMENLCEELGDVLMLVLLNSQIADEKGAFTIEQVIDGVSEKMIRRHPHVFGDAQVNQIKAQEKAEKRRKCLDKSQ